MPKDQPFVVPILERKVAFEGMIWNVLSESFDFGEQRLTREFIDHPGAVAVAAINERDQILLIRQYRHPVREYLWEIPAGLMDIPGEDQAQAAARELHEETGYQAESWQELISFYTTPGGNNEKIGIFTATDLRFIGRPENQDGEERDMEIRWFDQADALNSVLSGDIKNPSTVVAIMALALRQNANRKIS